MSEITYVVTVDEGKFAKMALYQIKSIIQNNSDPNIFVYITEGRGTESISEDQEEWIEEVAHTERGRVPISEYPISAKTKAAAEASSKVDSEYLLVLDTDMLVLDSINLPEKKDLLMTPVNIGDQEWGKKEKQKDWRQLCKKYGIERPDFSIRSTVDDRELIFPMYNVGVMFMRNNDFADRWTQIESEMYNEFGGFHFLHQIAASLLAADYEVEAIGEKYNYPMNLRYYCPSDVKILHYHSFNMLRKFFHPKIKSKIERTGVLSEQGGWESYWRSIYVPIESRFLRSYLKGLPANPIQRAIDNPRKAYEFIKNTTIRSVEKKSSYFGRSIYNYDWDCAVILDACRYDLAVENNLATDLLGDPERAYSLGANSRQWLTRTFREATMEQCQDTYYVTANLFSEDTVPESVRCKEVWKTRFDEELSSVPPREVTNAAIRIGREEQPDRLLVHYMQPHLPPVDASLDIDLNLDFRSGWGDQNPWKAIEEGRLSPEDVVSAYKNNLSPVIKELKLLLENLSAEDVIVTADHGNMLGESGRWGHFRPHAMHPGVRFVPWWEASAEDLNNHSPEKAEMERKNNKISREAKLRALGYKE